MLLNPRLEEMTYGLLVSLAGHGVLFGGIAMVSGHYHPPEAAGVSVEIVAPWEIVGAPAPIEEMAPPARAAAPSAPESVTEVAHAEKRQSEHRDKPRAITPRVQSARQTGSSSSIASGVGSGANSSIGVAGAGVQVARADYLSNPKPVYPESARRARREGRVVLHVHVSSDGLVDGLVVKESSGSEILDGAAVGAVRRWRFTPARLGGVPVPSAVDVPIRFDLDEAP